MNKALVFCSIMVLSLLFAAGLCAAEEGPDKIVTAEGFAPYKESDLAASRHASIADALRRAIEDACGVTVEAETKTAKYALTRDTVHTSAEGFVRRYRILEEGPSGDTYRIKIEATVAPGSPVKSLSYLCKRLNQTTHRSFIVSVPGIAGKTILGQLSTLGLKVVDQTKAPRVGAVAIRGRAVVEPLGEPIEDTGIFSSRAAVDLTISEAGSGAGLPTIGVEIDQPIASSSQMQANREAERAAAVLWVQRNMPVVVNALLAQGKAADREDAGTPLPVAPSPTTPSMSEDTEYAAEPAAARTEGEHTPASHGPRVILSEDGLPELVDKLKRSVERNEEFATTPVDIVVARFRLIGVGDTALAEDVEEDLSTALANSGVFEVVERNQLDRVLKELRIQNSGMVDSSTARKLGRLVGAKAVLIGSISDRGERVVINARLINTESGRIRVAESISIEKESEPEAVVHRAGSQR